MESAADRPQTPWKFRVMICTQHWPLLLLGNLRPAKLSDARPRKRGVTLKCRKKPMKKAKFLVQTGKKTTRNRDVESYSNHFKATRRHFVRKTVVYSVAGVGLRFSRTA